MSTIVDRCRAAVVCHSHDVKFVKSRAFDSVDFVIRTDGVSRLNREMDDDGDRCRSLIHRLKRRKTLVFLALKSPLRQHEGT
jgi:hypothetical protein